MVVVVGGSGCCCRLLYLVVRQYGSLNGLLVVGVFILFGCCSWGSGCCSWLL